MEGVTSLMPNPHPLSELGSGSSLTETLGGVIFYSAKINPFLVLNEMV